MTLTLDESLAQNSTPKTSPAGIENGVAAFWTGVLGDVLQLPETFQVADPHDMDESLSLPEEVLRHVDANQYFSDTQDMDESGPTRTDAMSKENAADHWVLVVNDANEDIGSVDIAGGHFVAAGATKTAVASAVGANGYVLSGWRLDLGAWTVWPVADPTTYVVPAQTIATHHALECRWVLGFSISCSNTNKDGYHARSSGESFAWSAPGAAPPGEHWHFDWNGSDLGHSSGLQTAAAGTANTASCHLELDP